MPVNEIRARISLTDNMSGKLTGINSTLGAFQGKLTSSAGAIRSFNTSLSDNSINNYAQSVKNANGMVDRLVYSATRYMIIYKAMAGVGDIWDMAVGGAYRYSKAIETNTIGVAGILTSMTKIEGRQLQWNEAMQISGDIMSQLRNEALRTAATTEDLMEVFRAILGPGLAAGMNTDEIVKLSTVGVNAVKSMGLPHNQLVQELRDLVQGGIQPASSTLATALGLKDADIKAAKESSEGLFKFLMKRLEGFDKSVGATSESMAGRMARIQEGLNIGIARGGENLKQYYSDALGKLADSLILVKETVDETGKKTKRWEINPALEQATATISGDIINILDNVKKIGEISAPVVKLFGSGLTGALHGAAQNAGLLMGTFAMYKGSQIFKDLANLRSGGEMQTVVGRYANTAYQVLTGNAKAVQVLTDAQLKLNQYTADYNALLEEHRNMKAFLKASGDSVLNLSQKWQQMGVEAKVAEKMQQDVLKTLIGSGQKAADEVMRINNAYAESVRYLQLFNEEASKIRAASGAGITNAASKVQSDIAKQRGEWSNTKNGNRSTESVTRLAEQYRLLGVEAGKAAEMQKQVQQLVLAGSNAQAEALMKQNEQYAINVKKAKEAQAEWNAAFKEQLAGIKNSIAANAELSASERRVLNFATAKNTSAEYTANIQLLTDYLKSLGFTQKEVYDLTLQYVNVAKSGHKEAAAAVYEEITAKAELLAKEKAEIASKERIVQITKEWTSVDYSKLTGEQLKLLEFDANHILNLSSQKEMVGQVRAAEEALNTARTQGFITEEQYSKTRTELLKQVATGYVDVAAAIGREISEQTKLGVLAGQTADKIVTEKLKEAEARQRIITLSAEELNAQDRLYLEYDAVNKIRQSGDEKALALLTELIRREKQLEETLKGRGMSSKEASTAYISTLQQMVTAENTAHKAQLERLNTTIKSAEAEVNHASTISDKIGKYAMLTMGLGVLGEQTASALDIEDSFFNTLIGGISTLANITFAVDMLTSSMKALGIQAGITWAAVLGPIGIGVGVGTAAAGLFASLNDLSWEDIKKRYTYSKEDWDNEDKKAFEMANALGEGVIKSYDEKETLQKAKQLELAYPKVPDHSKELKKAESTAEKARKKAEKELTKWNGKVQELSKDLNTKITEATGSSLEVASASLAAEIEKMNSTLANAKVAGTDAKEIEAVQKKIYKYKELKTAQNNRDWLTEEHNYTMSTLQAIEDSYGAHFSTIDNLRIGELERYKGQLAAMLENEDLTQKEILRIRQEYATASQALVEAQTNDLKASWENALDEVKNYQADFYGSFTEGFQNILGEFENFGQNMLTDQKSFSDRSSELFKNLANDIINMMMKVIMKGLVMNAIMGIFGLGGKTPTTKDYLGDLTSGVGGKFALQAPDTGHFANGGIAKGWSIVGEEGPELVNFTNPGRVYTADQTRQAMGVGSGNVNIKVMLENKSGTQLQAQQSSTQFDGESYIIGVVIKAAANNTGGFRTILKGVATS